MTDPIDLTIAARFVAALAGDAAAPVHWQTFDDNKERSDKSLADNACLPLATARRWLTEANVHGAGVYVTVNVTDGRGREIENVTELRALFVDCDGTRDLPSSWPLPPSIIVQRDTAHWHAYWLLRDGGDLEGFTRAQVQLACHWGTDCTIADLPRVMRCPGFWHCKASPILVSLVEAEPARRYTMAEILAAHPVADYAALPKKHQRKAELAGLWTPPDAVPSAATAPRPTVPRSDAGQDDEAWHEEMFAKWAMSKDTAEGAANSYEGRDNAAFVIACEGAGRGLRRDVVLAVVLAYLQRARVLNPDADADRVVGSAFSKPRKGTRPVRGRAPGAAGGVAPPRRGTGGGSFLDDDGPTPPAPPIPPAGDPAPEPEPEPYDGLDLQVVRERWSIGVGGVAPIEWDSRRGEFVVKQTKRVANLPIWPAQVGRDAATGKTFLRIGWVTPDGELRHSWMPEESVKVGKPLLDLAEGPIAGTRWQAAAVWLTEARPAIRQPLAHVTSRLGWCGVNGSRRWVWPGSGDSSTTVYIGDALPGHGDLDGWKRGLEHVLSLGAPGFVALLCAALSAASPWARLINGKRNPVIGLQARSSSGKGSVLGWVLAIWAEADSLTLPASSSVKGLQDRAVQYPDLPIFCDELQQLLEQGLYGQSQASEAVYFLANGQRRVTSSKAQVSVGGEARHGVGFYAAEAPILTGLNQGVQLRTVELRGDPCPDEQTARILRQAGQHTGILAGEISRQVQAATVTEWIEALRASSADLRQQHEGLEAGDSDVLALVQRGCDVLEQACGVDLPTADLVAWLAAEISAQRKSAVDRERACLQAVLDWLGNLDWTFENSDGQIGYRQEIALQLHMIAWSTWIVGPQGHVRATLECDPTHRELAAIFDRYGGEKRVLPAWAARGWIERQGAHLKVRRRSCGRVVRFTRAALAEHFGEEDLAPVEPGAPAPEAQS